MVAEGSGAVQIDALWKTPLLSIKTIYYDGLL